MPATLHYTKSQTREGMQFTLRDGKTRLPITLLGAIIRIRVYDERNDSVVIIDDYCTIIEPAENGICVYYTKEGDMDRVGKYKVQLDVTFGDDSQSVITDLHIVINNALL